ncbi:hypothetical protein [Marivita sp.]|uniref:hypothetical protein n=1 Tax=Marivita sp. TaxID=2003365 RepID=UPI003B5156D2
MSGLFGSVEHEAFIRRLDRSLADDPAGVGVDEEGEMSKNANPDVQVLRCAADIRLDRYNRLLALSALPPNCDGRLRSALATYRGNLFVVLLRMLHPAQAR